MCGVRDRKTARPNIGNTVAFSVAAADVRFPCDIDSERVNRAQPGPFSNENDDRISSKNCPNLISDGHPTLLNQHHWTRVPRCRREQVTEGTEQSRGMKSSSRR